MKNLRSTSVARFWVFVTLLAFTTQIAGVAASGVLMSNLLDGADHVMPDCHGHGKKIAQDGVNSTPPPVFESCCDGDCSMMGCQVAYALINSVADPYLIVFSPLSYPVPSAAPCQRHDSLYRPPILG